MNRTYFEGSLEPLFFLLLPSLLPPPPALVELRPKAAVVAGGGIARAKSKLGIAIFICIV